VTLLAYYCAIGSLLPPGLIYAAAHRAIRSSWVEDIKAGEHDVFISSSLTGWSNNNLGLAWLKQVFNRCTKQRDGDCSSLMAKDLISRESLSTNAIDIGFSSQSFLLIRPVRSSRSMWYSSIRSSKLTQLSSPLIFIEPKASSQSRMRLLPLFWRA
jgi:hypothetical protein